MDSNDQTRENERRPRNPIYDPRSRNAPETASNPGHDRAQVGILNNPSASSATRYSWSPQAASGQQELSIASQQDYLHYPQRLQEQSYEGYGGSEMYSMLSQQQQASYGAVPPYPAREPLSAGGSHGQVTIPQQYMTGRPGYSDTAQPGAASLQRPRSSYLSDPYAPTMPLPEVNLQSSFGTGLHEGQDVPTLVGPTVQSQRVQQSQSLIDIYATYRNHLLHAFQNIHDENMQQAAHFVLQASELLLRNVAELDLVLDNETTYANRLALFREFNRCWLALGQTQVDLTEAAIQAAKSSGPSLVPPTLIPVAMLEGMGHDLIRLCDSIQKQGLVDYEMGVEEERILEILIRCMDLLKKLEGDEETAGGRPDSWPSTSRPQ